MVNWITDTKWKHKMRKKLILLVLYDNHPSGLLEREIQCYVSIIAENMGIDDIL